MTNLKISPYHTKIFQPPCSSSADPLGSWTPVEDPCFTQRTHFSISLHFFTYVVLLERSYAFLGVCQPTEREREKAS